MHLIVHITRPEQWEQALAEGQYRGDTLDSEGFIHCSTATQVVDVANARFRDRQDLILLCIDTDRLQAPLRHEPAEGQLFPHIYGPLNTDAVVATAPFPASADGSFTLPAEVTTLGGDTRQ